MKKFILKPIAAILALAICAAVVLAIFFALQPAFYRNYLTSRIVEEAEKRQAKLLLKNLSATPLALHVEDIDIFLPRAFFSLKIDRFDLSNSFLALLNRAVSMQWSGDLYGGTMSGKLGYIMSADSLSGEAALSGLALERHQQIKGLGFERGLFDLHLSKLHFEKQLLKDAELWLSLKNADKPSKTTFMLKVMGGQIPAEIPAITSLNLNIRARYLAPSLKITEARSTSSVGEFGAKGEIVVTDTLVPKEIRLRIEGALTDGGAVIVGPYLALVSNNRLTSQTRSFAVNVSGPYSRPTVVFEPL